MEILSVVIFSTRPGLQLRLAAVKIADTLSLSPLLRVCFPELTVVFQEHMLPHSTFW